MPIVRIDMLAGRSHAVKQALAADLTTLVARHLGTEPGHIYVLFNDVSRQDWAVGGQLFDRPLATDSTSDSGGGTP